MLRKLFKKYLSLTAVFVILLTINVYGSVPAGPSISSSSAILVDTVRGQVLYNKNPNKKVSIPIASKLMTMLLAIENTSLDSKVTISKESATTEGSLVNLVAGEKYTVEDLLYAALLASANDSANALAETIAAGDTEKFVIMMNEKAKALGLKNTKFTNPSGLYDENQYTTAEDLAILVRNSLRNATFNSIFSTSARPWSSDGKSSILINQNKLFWWGYEGIDGGSVGYGNDQMYSSVSSATRGNQRLICIALEAKQDLVFNDSIKILDYGFGNFIKSLLVSKGKVLTSIEYEANELPLSTIEEIYYTHPIGESYIKSIDYNIKKELPKPLKKDMVLGTARYTLQDDTTIDVSLYSSNEIKVQGKITDVLRIRLMENRDIFFLLVILCILEVIVILFNILKFIKKRVYR